MGFISEESGDCSSLINCCSISLITSVGIFLEVNSFSIDEVNCFISLVISSELLFCSFPRVFFSSMILVISFVSSSFDSPNSARFPMILEMVVFDKVSETLVADFNTAF